MNLRLAAAFREAIDEIRSATVLTRVVERLERGDINGALEAMQIEPDHSQLEIALQEAFIAAAAPMPLAICRRSWTRRVIASSGPWVRNPDAEAILRDLSSTMVTRITDDQREGVLQTLEQAGFILGDQRVIDPIVKDTIHPAVLVNRVRAVYTANGVEMYSRRSRRKRSRRSSCRRNSSSTAGPPSQGWRPTTRAPGEGVLIPTE